MRVVLILFGWLSALATLATFSSLADAVGKNQGLAAGILTGQFISILGLTLFCFFAAEVLRHLARQRAERAKIYDVLVRLRDILDPPAPEVRPEPGPGQVPVEPAPQSPRGRVEPRLGSP